MNSKDIVAGLDIGTTGVKALIVDTAGRVLGLGYREYPCLFPHPGWMEQDVTVMWPEICQALRAALADRSTPGKAAQDRRSRSPGRNLVDIGR